MARATGFAFAYSTASCGQIKPVIVAFGITSSSTDRPSVRRPLLSSAIIDINKNKGEDSYHYPDYDDSMIRVKIPPDIPMPKKRGRKPKKA